MEQSVVESPKIVSLTRESFYDILWSVTGQELRVQYALTPYGLQQLCLDHRLPVPPVGYWSKYRKGKKVRRPPLPCVQDTSLETIQLIRLWEPGTEPKLEYLAVPVPSALSAAHRLTKEFAISIQTAKANSQCVTTNLCVETHVSPNSTDRVLCIFDTLAKAFEDNGGEIFRGEHGWLWGRPPDGIGLRFDSEPAEPEQGVARELLTLMITTNRQVGVPSTWGRGRDGRLEGKLRQIINSIWESVARIRWDRFDSSCRERQRAALALLRQAEKQKAAVAHQDEQIGRDLMVEAQRFHEAAILRRYLSAIRRQLKHAELDANTRQELETKIERGHRFADSIDPLVQLLPATASRPPTIVPIGQLDISPSLRKVLVKEGLTDTDAIYQWRKLARSPLYGEKGDELDRVLTLYGYLN